MVSQQLNTLHRLLVLIAIERFTQKSVHQVIQLLKSVCDKQVQ